MRHAARTEEEPREGRVGGRTKRGATSGAGGGQRQRPRAGHPHAGASGRNSTAWPSQTSHPQAGPAQSLSGAALSRLSQWEPGAASTRLRANGSEALVLLGGAGRAAQARDPLRTRARYPPFPPRTRSRVGPAGRSGARGAAAARRSHPRSFPGGCVAALGAPLPRRLPLFAWRM